MKSNEKLDDVLKELAVSLTPKEKESLKDYFADVVPGKIIYPSDISKKTGISLLTIYKICIRLAELNSLKQIYYCVCPRCKRMIADFLFFNEIPTMLVCGCGFSSEKVLENIYLKYMFKA